MAIKNIKVKVNVENNFVIDKTEEKKLCKILVAKGDKGQDGNVSFDELTEEQKAQLKGEDGKGIPEGGTAGQILAKTSDDDFDAEWIDNNAEIDLTEYAKKEELPTKVSELENDVYYVKSNDPSVKFNGRVHIYNGKTDGNGRKVDLLVEHIQGGGYGGYEADLHINYRNPLDVHILQGGEGKLYYKDKEVATQEYVNEQIANIDISNEDIDLTDYAKKEELHNHDNKDVLDSISQEDIDNWNNNTGETNYELPIASAGTLGGIKVGMNLSIDADGTLNAVGGGTGESSVVNGEVLPIGTMIPFGSQNNIPANWRICDGSEVSRTAYADLFNVIGTSYGEGDGETTFNLPNKRGRVSVGLDLDQSEFNVVGLKDGQKKVVLKTEELPPHSHEFTRSRLYFSETAGPNALGATSNASNSATATTQNTGDGLGHYNLQPYEVDVWIIKVSNVIGTLETENANVIDNLTSTSTTDVLSANMGRELNEKINNIDVLEEYSTEEKVIGKWLDGETLYEKTFIATSKTIDLSGLNYDTLLITYFGMYVSNYIMTPYYTSSSDYLKILVTDQKQLSMITSHTSFTKAIMVVRYTKKA